MVWMDESSPGLAAADPQPVPGGPSCSAGTKAFATVAATALAACGGEGESGAPRGSGSPVPTVAVRKPQNSAEAARFILQTGIGASDEEVSAVQTQGYEPWLRQQMVAASPSGVEWLAAKGFSTVDANRWFDKTEPADYMIWHQMMSGGNEVRTRAALALSEFFVVSLNGVEITWRSQAMARYWDLLTENAFGDFRTLLEEVTLSPAMGVWLNTRGNRKADASGRVPDENFAREVMQLFTIGLVELNPDGTPKDDGSGRVRETYTSADVSELAKAFTGYDFDYTGNVTATDPGNGSRTIDGIAYTQNRMTADPGKWKRPGTRSYHSEESKTFLGTTIPAATSATETLRIALDTLFNHPNTGPFFARQMIQRLITSNPSPAFVRRVADVFANNGSGKRGDLAAVFRAVWLDEEALTSANLTSTTFGKVREPILRLAQWARSFGAASESGNWAVRETQSSSGRLGQSPLRSPSVFNFFRPGYVPANSTTGNARLVAPELQLVNEVSAAGYVNFIAKVIEGKEGATNDLRVSYTREIALAHTPAALVDRLDLLLTAGQLSQQSKSTILAAIDDGVVSETSEQAAKLRRVHAAVLLVMCAPEYLVQR